MAEDSGTNGLGVRAAERRASFRSRTLHFLARILTIALRTKASDRPSDSERRQRPAARPLPLFGPAVAPESATLSPHGAFV